MTQLNLNLYDSIQRLQQTHDMLFFLPTPEIHNRFKSNDQFNY